MHLKNPIHHGDDPSSSVEAADLVTRSGARECHAKAVLWLVKEHPDSTAIELGEHSDLGEYQIRRRLTDLKAAGRIAQGEARACRVRGTSMVTWRAVDERPEPEVREVRTVQAELFN